MAITHINTTGDRVIAEMSKMRAQWGYRAWQYNAPFLPGLGKGPEYWCVDYWLEGLRRSCGFDWRSFGVPTATMYLQQYMARNWREVSLTNAAAGDAAIMGKAGGNEWSTYHFFSPRGPMVNGVMDTEQGDTSLPQFPGTNWSGGCFGRKNLYWSDVSGNSPDRVRVFRPPYIGGGTPTVVVSPGNPSGWDTSTQQNLNADLSPYDAKRLQTVLGVKADGILGPGTVSALQVKFGRKPDGVLSAPDSSVVESLQRFLNSFRSAHWCHYGQLAVDGDFGPSTARALSAYMSARGSFRGAQNY